MMIIQLANDRGQVMVDDDDYETLSSHSWCLYEGGGNRQRVYAQANVKVDGVWRRVFMHRFILGLGRGQRCDHRDNNGLNNQRSNLRLASRGQNQHNSGSRGGTSRFKGVCWSKSCSKWLAQIMANKRRCYLGVFEDEEDAARAYDAKAKELHGDFAKLNFKN